MWNIPRVISRLQSEFDKSWRSVSGRPKMLQLELFFNKNFKYLQD